PPPRAANVLGGQDSLVRPTGRFCGSARESSVPCELPQIFHVATELLSLSLNHAFCSAPRIVCGGALRCGLGTCASLNRISAGGLPPLKARPPSRARISDSGNIPMNSSPPSFPRDGSLKGSALR